jgi:hypothetical protein
VRWTLAQLLRKPGSEAGTAHAYLFGHSTWNAALQGVSHLFLMSPPGRADAYGLLAT